MNTKRTLRIVRHIIREYEDGNVMNSMRQFVSTLRAILVATGPECEETVKQTLRILFADIDRSPLNLIPDRHLDFLRGLHDRELVGSGLKRTVMELISEGSFTKVVVLQQFSDLLSAMLDLGDRLKSIEQTLSMLNISVEDIPSDKAIINAIVIPERITSNEFSTSIESVVSLMREISRLAGGADFSVEIQAGDHEESVVSFMVERPMATLFCVIYLGILDTYAYINNFDTQISNLKSLKTSKGVLNVLEKEKKRMLSERLVVSTNMALAEFFKDAKYPQEMFDQTYAIVLNMVNKIEEGFDFDIEIGPQHDLGGAANATGDKLIHYLFAINKLLPPPRKGLSPLLDDLHTTKRPVRETQHSSNLVRNTALPDHASPLDAQYRPVEHFTLEML